MSPDDPEPDPAPDPEPESDPHFPRGEQDFAQHSFNDILFPLEEVNV